MDISTLLTPSDRSPDPGLADASDPGLPPVRLRLLRAVDSRPPARSWAGLPLSAPSLQPSLLTPEVEPMPTTPPTTHPDRSAPLLVGLAWSATPATHLPDAVGWSGQMARLLVETLHGQRPVGQLTRWVDERVLASVTVLLRGRAARIQRAVPHGAPSRLDAARRPPVLQSIRVQCPSPEVLEVSVHLRVGHRSEAIAFRLEGWYDRWLCTVLEIGPRHSRGVEEG